MVRSHGRFPRRVDLFQDFFFLLKLLHQSLQLLAIFHFCVISIDVVVFLGPWLEVEILIDVLPQVDSGQLTQAGPHRVALFLDDAGLGQLALAAGGFLVAVYLAAGVGLAGVVGPGAGGLGVGAAGIGVFGDVGDLLVRLLG